MGVQSRNLGGSNYRKSYYVQPKSHKVDSEVKYVYWSAMRIERNGDDKNYIYIAGNPNRIDGFLTDVRIDTIKFQSKDKSSMVEKELVKFTVIDGQVQFVIQMPLMNYKGNAIDSNTRDIFSKLLSQEKLGRLVFETTRSYNYYAVDSNGKKVYDTEKNLVEKYGADNVFMKHGQNINIYNSNKLEELKPWDTAMDKILSESDEDSKSVNRLWFGLYSNYLHPVSATRVVDGEEVKLNYEKQHKESFLVGYDYSKKPDSLEKGFNEDLSFDLKGKAIDSSFKKGMLPLLQELIQASANDYDTSMYPVAIEEVDSDGNLVNVPNPNKTTTQEQVMSDLPADMKETKKVVVESEAPKTEVKTEAVVEQESYEDESDEEVDDLPF